MQMLECIFVGLRVPIMRVNIKDDILEQIMFYVRNLEGINWRRIQ